MQQKGKTVYVPMCADIVHPGHLNIIKTAHELGEVVVGLLADEAIASKKRLPYMNYQQRYEVLSNIKGVDRIIAQTTVDYSHNLRELKPDYVVHGDDWTKQAKQQVIDAISEWNGKLIEVEYTDSISSTKIKQNLRSLGISAPDRLKQLSNLLDSKKTIRALEAHNGLSALVVENTTLKNDLGKVEQFDAIWISSLTDSIAKGKPDSELVDVTSRLATINEILEVTTKPLIVDGDTGGHAEHFKHTVRTLERLGVSAVVIEDKNGLKHNSLHDNTSDHHQEDIETFAAKIRAGVAARADQNFMIIARIESLILGKSQKDALDRATAYIKSGADAIMIHSKDKSGKDIKMFAKSYNKFEQRMPLMLVPTSYNKITDDKLSEIGANIVVYANHLLRSAYPAMEKSAQMILQNHRAFEVEEFSTSIEDFLKMIPRS